MNETLDALGDRLAAAAGAAGHAVAAPRLSGSLAGEILDFAGAVAHTSERRFAPLAAFMAGVVAGRAGEMREEEILAMLARVRAEVEPGEVEPGEVGPGAKE